MVYWAMNMRPAWLVPWAMRVWRWAAAMAEAVGSASQQTSTFSVRSVRGSAATAAVVALAGLASEQESTWRMNQSAGHAMKSPEQMQADFGTGVSQSSLASARHGPA